MDEKQSFTHRPGTHLSLHTCLGEIQLESARVPEIKASSPRAKVPGALPLSLVKTEALRLEGVQCSLAYFLHASSQGEDSKLCIRHTFVPSSISLKKQSS